MSGNISQNLPQIQDFLTQTLRTGNIDNDLISQSLANLQTGNAAAQRDITRRVTGSMPMGSSAATSALTKGLSDQQLSSTQQMLQFLQNQGQQGLSNKFGAASTMMGLPGYIGAPSSIETAMIGAKTPYALGNLNSQSDWLRMLLQGNQSSYYTPELNVEPSPWSQFASPLISGIIKGLMGGAGGMHSGGVVLHRGGIVKKDPSMAIVALAMSRRLAYAR